MKYINRIDRIAPYYDRLAYLVYGRAIRKAQEHYLADIPPHSNVLVLGGGTGWWLPKLLNENTASLIWYVEASAKMIAYAKRNAGHSARVRFIHGTHEDIPEHVRFHAVVTFFFLDVFDNQTLTHIVGRIRRTIKKKGIWLVVDFVNEKKWHLALLYIMYWFFCTLDAMDTRKLPEWELIMARMGASSVKSKDYFGNFIRSYCYQV